MSECTHLKELLQNAKSVDPFRNESKWFKLKLKWAKIKGITLAKWFNFKYKIKRNN